MTERERSDTAAEVRATASMLRGVLAPVRMLSGGFRSRVSEALGAAAALEDERRSILADRDAMRQEMRDYRTALQQLTAEIGRVGAESNATLQRAIQAETEAVAAHRRAFQFEEKTRRLEELERDVVAQAAAMAKGHEEARALLARLGEDARAGAALHQETTRLQESLLAHLASLDERGAAVLREETELADRRRDLVAGEGFLAAGRASLLKEDQKSDADRMRLDAEAARLASLVDRVEKDQAAVADARRALAGTEQAVRAHEDRMAAHCADLARRLSELDARGAQIAERAAELDARKGAHDRERLEIDARLRELAPLEQRHEELLRTKAMLDEESRRLHAETAGVRENQTRTIETWEALKRTLAEAQDVAQRSQATHDRIEAVRAEMERRDRELTEAARSRSLAIDAREREILNWRMQAELRERKVQERYNELDQVEARRDAVRAQVERLESEQAARIAGFEREQHRVRELWAERRAEAEKARELYERNTAIVQRRLDEILHREKEHAERAEELAAKTTELADRERRLRTHEERVRLLEAQRDSLNQVIAALTAKIGGEWPSPEARLDGGARPPALDAPLPAPGTSPGAQATRPGAEPGGQIARPGTEPGGQIARPGAEPGGLIARPGTEPGGLG